MARTSRTMRSTGWPLEKPGPPTSSAASSTAALTDSVASALRVRIASVFARVGTKPWFLFSRIMSSRASWATVNRVVISPTTGANSAPRHAAARLACSAAASAIPT